MLDFILDFLWPTNLKWNGMILGKQSFSFSHNSYWNSGRILSKRQVCRNERKSSLSMRLQGHAVTCLFIFNKARSLTSWSTVLANWSLRRLIIDYIPTVTGYLYYTHSTSPILNCYQVESENALVRASHAASQSKLNCTVQSYLCHQRGLTLLIPHGRRFACLFRHSSAVRAC